MESAHSLPPESQEGPALPGMEEDLRAGRGWGRDEAATERSPSH